MGKIEFFDRPLAFTDVETTGRDPLVHEIIEIGLVVADQRTLAVIDELEVKVRPTHIDLAEPRALEVNGYRPEDWTGAVSLREAIAAYAEKTREAILIAHNATFDWDFVRMAFRTTGVSDQMDFHRLCCMSMAFAKLKRSGLRKFGLIHVARHLGVPEEPLPHRAVHGARTVYEVYKRLDALP